MQANIDSAKNTKDYIKKLLENPRYAAGLYASQDLTTVVSLPDVTLSVNPPREAKVIAQSPIEESYATHSVDTRALTMYWASTGHYAFGWDMGFFGELPTVTRVSTLSHAMEKVEWPHQNNSFVLTRNVNVFKDETGACVPAFPMDIALVPCVPGIIGKDGWFPVEFTSHIEKTLNGVATWAFTVGYTEIHLAPFGLGNRREFEHHDWALAQVILDVAKTSVIPVIVCAKHHTMRTNYTAGL